MNRVTMLMLMALLLAIPPLTSAQEKQAPQDAAAQLRATIVSWLECEECTDGELEAVLKLGDRALPTLAAVLAEGPSAASLEAHRIHLQETYRALKEYEKQHPDSKVEMAEDEYVNTYLSNYVALHKTRAAIALGRIGGPQARDALRKALQGPLRENVRDAVRRSLERMEHPPQ